MGPGQRQVLEGVLAVAPDRETERPAGRYLHGHVLRADRREDRAEEEAEVPRAVVVDEGHQRRQLRNI